MSKRNNNCIASLSNVGVEFGWHRNERVVMAKSHHFQPKFTFQSCQQQQIRTLSFSTSSSNKKNNNNSNSIKSQLRKLTKPFLLLVHPDRTKTHSLSSKSQSINLNAIQTLNGLLDNIEHLYNRAFVPSTKLPRAASGKMELKETYPIEFVVTRSSSSTKKTSHKKKEKDELYISTVKSVDITFPNRIRNGVQLMDMQSGRYSKKYAMALKNWTIQELYKLLRVAGLSVPLSSDLEKGDEEDGNDDGKAERRFSSEDLLLEELDIDLHDDNEYDSTSPNNGGRRFENMSQHPFRGRTKKKTKWEQSREEFMNKIDWKAFKVAYDQLYADAEADLATVGYISNNPQLKREFVSNIISRIRIMDTTATSTKTTLNNGDETTQTEKDEIKKHGQEQVDEETRKKELGLDTIHQLIAIRRLSLILYDYFDELEMESMGRLWENTTLVLTPERQKLKKEKEEKLKHNTPSDIRRASLKKKKKTKSKESGFKFALKGGSNKDDITIYIPIDFQDEEFVEELNAYMWDLYDMKTSQKDGTLLGQFDIENLMPSLKNKRI